MLPALKKLWPLERIWVPKSEGEKRVIVVIYLEKIANRCLLDYKNNIYAKWKQENMEKCKEETIIIHTITIQKYMFWHLTFQVLSMPAYIFLNLYFNWRKIALHVKSASGIQQQCESAVTIHTSPLSWASLPFSHPSLLGHCRAPNLIPCVIQQLLTSFLSHTWECIYLMWGHQSHFGLRFLLYPEILG